MEKLENKNNKQEFLELECFRCGESKPVSENYKGEDKDFLCEDCENSGSDGKYDDGIKKAREYLKYLKENPNVRKK